MKLREERRKEKFRTLQDQFNRGIVATYDAKNTGPYFIHQGPELLGIDHKTRKQTYAPGIYYYNEGAELAGEGVSIVRRAAGIHAHKLSTVSDNFREGYFELVQRHPSQRTRILFRINRRENLDVHPYHLMYPDVAKHIEVTSPDYVQGMGEMMFHIVRILGMCNTGGKYLDLHKILQHIPCQRFLPDEKREEFLRGLVKECLHSPYNPGEKARKVLAQYEETIPTELEKKITEVESLVEKQRAFEQRTKEIAEKSAHKFANLRKAAIEN